MDKVPRLIPSTIFRKTNFQRNKCPNPLRNSALTGDFYNDQVAAIMSEKLWLTLKFLFWVFCLHVSLCTTCVHDAHRGQKKVLDALEQTWLCAAMWGLRLEPKSPIRTVSALNYWTIYPVLLAFILWLFCQHVCTWTMCVSGSEEVEGGCWTLWNGVVGGSKQSYGC